jgi:hypothetical protein
MPQPPLLVDVLQVQPGSGDTLTLSRDSSDGSLKFVDAIISSGVLLRELVGIKNITGLFYVGRAGQGAAYTSIQDAIDAIPNISSASAPSLVLVFPGEYQEEISIKKDGVCLVGLGGVTITNVSDKDTIRISSSTLATPKSVIITDVKVVNSSDGTSCISILGADAFASGTLTINSAPLATGDTVVISGVTLTGTAGNRTSGSNNFSVSSGFPSGIAAELVNAINDSNNSFSTLVQASSIGNVVTITSLDAGPAGNSITLSSVTTPAGGTSVSGPNLSGGSAAGNLVGDGSISINNCELVSSGLGGYQILADTVNHIRVSGGTFEGSSSTSSVSVSNCALFSVYDTEWVNDVELSYDPVSDVPNDVTCSYKFSYSERINDVIANMSTTGGVTFTHCGSIASVSQVGDRSLDLYFSYAEDISLGGTTQCILRNSTRRTASTISGSPTLSESTVAGFVSFLNSNSETINFQVLQPDSEYVVTLDVPSPYVTAAVTSRGISSFTVDTSVNCTGDINYVISRQSL